MAPWRGQHGLNVEWVVPQRCLLKKCRKGFSRSHFVQGHGENFIPGVERRLFFKQLVDHTQVHKVGEVIGYIRGQACDINVGKDQLKIGNCFYAIQQMFVVFNVATLYFR